MKIFNKTKNTVIASNAAIAKSSFARMKGLLGREGLSSNEALVILQCPCIHMFFMRFGIDVIFVDKYDKVVGLVEKIQPFQFSPFFYSASYAIEVSEGTIHSTQTAVGDEIKIL